ncbi:hypothetical protein D3C72_1361070 [compost metagenome]
MNDLLGFGSTSDTYKRFKTDLLLRGNKFVEVGNYDVPVLKKDTLLFLRFLVESDYDLYVLKDKYDFEHFYVIQDNDAHELIYKKQMINRNGALLVGEENTFRDQLNALLHAENTLKKKIGGAKYEQSDLLAIFDTYNKSNNRTVSTSNLQKNGLAYDFDIIAGMSNAYPSINALGISFTNSFKPSFGIGFTAYFTRDRKQLSIDNQLIYAAYSSHSKEVFGGANRPRISLNADYVKLINLIKYQYPKGFIRPYLGVGVGNAIALSIKAIDNTHSAPLFPETRKYEQSIVFLLGASCDRFKMEFRNDYANGFSSYATKTNATYYQFSIRYTLINR